MKKTLYTTIIVLTFILGITGCAKVMRTGCGGHCIPCGTCRG